MENKFDHIEDSVRKAFEGFELPVSDTDWSRISAGLETAGRRKGFAYWWHEKRGKLIVLLGVLFLFLGGIIYWLSNRSASNNILTDTAGKMENKDQSVKMQEPKASDRGTDRNVTGMESTGKVPSESNVASNSNLNPAGKNEKVNSGIGNNGSSPASGTPAHTPAYTPEKPVNEQPTPVKEPVAEVPQTPNPIVPTTPVKEDRISIPDFSYLIRFGLRNTLADHSPIILPFLVDPAIKHPFAKTRNTITTTAPNPPKSGLPVYVGLQTSYAPGGAKAQKGSEVWNGFQWIDGKNPALDIRFDAGVALGTGDWKFTLGGALEGNPVGSRTADTIRIIRAVKFFPYITLQDDTIWFVTKYDTMYVTNRVNPRRVWAEVPFGFYRTFDNKNNIKLSVGITFNPGVMLGSSGTMPNPYQYQSGSYWKYYHGLDVDTSSAVIPVKEFLNPIRLGNSIQLGIEKEMQGWNWGIQAQTRYYYTPVWKTGVPIKQNTIQYGINLRLGFKI